MNLLGELSGGLAPIAEAPVWAVIVLKVTLLLAAGWLVHMALARANPQWRVLLWRVTALGLIALPLLEIVPRGIELSVRRPTAAIAAGPLPAVPGTAHHDTPIPPRTTGPLPAATGGVELEAQDVSATRQAEPPAGTWSLTRLCRWALPAIWLAGVALLAARLVVGYVRICRVVRSCPSAPDWVIGRCREVARAIGYHRALPVRCCEVISTPMLCGLWRPVLLLPERMCADGYGTELPGVLAHELAHARAADCRWNAWLQVVSAWFWFHPLCWRMRRAHQAASDAACDAIAAGLLGDTKAYCRMLARVALQVAGAPPATGLAMAGLSSITRRLSALRRRVFDRPLRRRSVAGFALVALLAVGLIGGLRVVYAEAPPQEELEISIPTEPPAAENEPVKAAEGRMRVLVVDQSGEPVPGATVKVSLSGGPYAARQRNQHTCGTDGTIVIELPEEDEAWLSITVEAENLVPIRASWRDRGGEEDPIPAEFTFTLEQGVPIGGVVRNEQGRPIEGAQVQINRVSTDNSPPAERPRPSMGSRIVQTDAEGKWRCHVLSGASGELAIHLQHADYLSQTIANGDDRFAELHQPLKQQKAVLVMSKGITIAGTVTDPQGAPVAGARVSAGDPSRRYYYSYYSGPTRSTASGLPPGTVETDQQGRYRLPGRRPGRATVCAGADGLAADAQVVDVQPGMGPVDIRLQQGRRLRIRVVDRDGQPVSGVAVQPMRWRNGATLTGLRLPAETDQDGRWSWNGAPADELTFRLVKRGYMELVDQALQAGDAEHVITLPPPLVISGRVVDARTKAPVEEFRVVPGIDMGPQYGRYWERRERAVDSRQGTYRVEFSEPSNVRVIRIEAAGYRPVVSRPVKPQEGEATVDFAVQQGHPVTGMVRLGDGKPAAGAQVALCPQSIAVTVANGWQTRWSQSVTVKTDAAGRFKFPPQAETFTLVVLDRRGFAEVAEEDLAGSGQITIRPWARVEGTVRIGDRPGAGQSVMLWFVPSVRPAARLIRFQYNTRSDAEGRFTFERVIPGTGYLTSLARTDGSRSTQRQGIKLELEPGRTAEVQIGGTGRPAVGRVELPADADEKVRLTTDLFTGGLVQLSRWPPEPLVPRDLGQQDAEVRRQLYQQWLQSPEGKRRQETDNVRYTDGLSADGSYRLEDVPPGQYRLEVSVPLPPEGRATHYKHYQALKEVTIGGIPGRRSDQPFDLGTVKLEFKQVPVANTQTGRFYTFTGSGSYSSSGSN